MWAPVLTFEQSLEKSRERFLDKVLRGNECWEWQGATSENGYGQFRVGDKTLQAHRVSWLLHFGPIPDGMCVCHKCDNRSCVKPGHFFLGTLLDNIQDKVNKGRQSKGPSHQAACRGPRPSMQGSRHPHSRLTEDQVRDIREAIAFEERTQVVAARYGVHMSTIERIAKYQSWTHVV